MNKPPKISERTKLLLNEWRSHLTLTKREETFLAGPLKTLDNQIQRLNERNIRIAAFGRVGVGKSSLLNALIGQQIFATDVAHGCTRRTKSCIWDQPFKSLNSIELVDTPGIDEISEAGRARLASRVAMQVDLVLLVIDSDITRVELDALKILVQSGKPIVLTLNRCDQWKTEELANLLISIRNRLPSYAKKLEIITVSAAPRKYHLKANGFARSKPTSPRVASLINHLKKLLSKQGEILLAINSLRESDHFYQNLKQDRLKRSKEAAQTVIGQFAALKASGVAINPLLILDLAGGLACDTALVIQLSKVYGLQIEGHSARQLLKRLSIHNAFLGGTQIGIQFALGLLRHILIALIPITGGLSLASAAPVALAQALLAVHTTQKTGRLAAKMLLLGIHRRGTQPSAMIQRLVNNDPSVRFWINHWSQKPSREATSPIQALLP